jgi:hypothetical protein
MEPVSVDFEIMAPKAIGLQWIARWGRGAVWLKFAAFHASEMLPLCGNIHIEIGASPAI